MVIGIFDHYAASYDIKHKALTYSKLKTLKEDDGGKIYNQIMEILCHNAISDKPNSFNKLLNLFVRKIVDEDKNADDELETDTDESLQLWLNDLYKDGMWRFLEIDVIDYRQEEVTQKYNRSIYKIFIRRGTFTWLEQPYQDGKKGQEADMIKVTVWNENLHEQRQEEVRRIYPQGIHGCIADFLRKDREISVRTATLEEPGHGLTEAVLADTDVLVYWGHKAHHEFSDEVAERVRNHVLQGMGLVALHSAHLAKIMRLLMGTSMTLRWKHGDRERLFVTAPYHPIARGVSPHFDIPEEEMYGEYFDIPKPDDVVFTGWFAGGEVFRSGCTFQRGLGRIFYFQPGHEEYPVYHMPEIQRIITNAVYWCSEVRRQQEPPGCTAVKVTLEEEYVNPMKLSVFYDHIVQAVNQANGGRSLNQVMGCCSDWGIRGIDIEYSQLCADYDRVCEALRYNYMEIASIYQFYNLRNQPDISSGKELIGMAHGLGVKRVLIVPGFLDGEEAKALHSVSGNYFEVEHFMEQNLCVQAMRTALTELVQYAGPLGVAVTLEDFDDMRSPCARMNELLWFMRNVPGLKCTFDMGNFAYGYENVMEAYELLRRYIVHVHCKDRGSEGNGLKSVPTGSGYIPVAQLVRKLKETGYRGYLSIEHFGDLDQMAGIEQSAHFLKTIV